MARWQPYSMLFASAGADKIVSVWDVRTSLCVLNFYGHNNAVNSVNFNLKGDLILSTDSDGIVKVWDVRMVKESHSFDCGLASAQCAAFDVSNTHAYIGSEDATVKVYNVNSGEKEAELKGHEDSVNAILIDSSKDGFMFTASSDCTFRVWQ